MRTVQNIIEALQELEASTEVRSLVITDEFFCLNQLHPLDGTYMGITRNDNNSKGLVREN